MINVLIDALSITKQKAGVGVYAKNIIDELVRLESNVHFFLLVQDDDPELNYVGRANVTMVPMNSRLLRIVPLRLLLEQLLLPVILLKYKIDIIHSLHYSFPLLHFGARQIVTLHDMTSFYMPEVHVRSKVIYFRFFIRAAVARADGIIFVSESARQDCFDLLGKPRGRSVVVHHGKNESLRPDVDIERMEQVRRDYGLPREYLLYIGTIEPRKNLAALVKAFASIVDKYASLHLVIAGKRGWNQELEVLTQIIRDTALTGRVIFPGFIDERDKPALLSAATIFVYPSLYEGFGLPVLEAMACGIPTITSAISSLPEVAGNGAILVDPRSVADIGSGIESLLSNPRYRDDLRERAIYQASQFSWQRSAAITLELYRSLAPDR